MDLVVLSPPCPETVPVGKKKNPEQPTRQVNIRLPADVHARAERAANVLGVDLAQLVRMAFYKALPRYEREAEEILREEGT